MFISLDNVKDFESELQKFRHKPIVLDFHEQKCKSCKLFLPTLKKLSKEYKKEVKIINIDVDYNEELASRFRVKKTPYLLFIKDREIIHKMTKTPSEEELRSHLEFMINSK